MPYPSMKKSLFDQIWPMLTFTLKFLSNLHKAESIACEFVARPFMQSIRVFNLMVSTILDGGIPY